MKCRLQIQIFRSSKICMQFPCLNWLLLSAKKKRRLKNVNTFFIANGCIITLTFGKHLFSETNFHSICQYFFLCCSHFIFLAILLWSWSFSCCKCKIRFAWMTIVYNIRVLMHVSIFNLSTTQKMKKMPQNWKKITFPFCAPIKRPLRRKWNNWERKTHTTTRKIPFQKTKKNETTIEMAFIVQAHCNRN